MLKDSFEEDVRGKLITRTSAAIEKEFKISPSHALIATGYLFEMFGYISTKEYIIKLHEIIKEPLTDKQKELTTYVCH